MYRLIQGGLVLASLILVAYWSVWFTDRSLLESATTRGYYDFENAFPLADGWLLVTCLAGFRALRRRRPSALFWLLAGGGAGLYLFGMDLLYNLQHGTFDNGAAGLTELAIVVVELVFSLTVLWWAWINRVRLLVATID